jgi:hypothetical protein
MVSSEQEDSTNAFSATPAVEAYPQAGEKWKSAPSRQTSPAEGSRKQCGPNGRPRKERQPNWLGPEVLALIAAKEEEHEAQKLRTDQRDLMEMATHKWSKIAEAVAKAGCLVYPRGGAACRDKWQTLFAEYKKIYDYKRRSGNNEDYFRMASKRRKDLGLPANFCGTQYRDMERFLSQRPCLNPPPTRETHYMTMITCS